VDYNFSVFLDMWAFVLINFDFCHRNLSTRRPRCFRTTPRRLKTAIYSGADVKGAIHYKYEFSKRNLQSVRDLRLINGCQQNDNECKCPIARNVWCIFGPYTSSYL